MLWHRGEMTAPSAPSEAADLRLAADVAESIADVIIAYEPDGTIVWASPSLTPVLGWDPAAVVGSRLRISTDEDAARADQITTEAIASGAATARARLRSRRSDGTVIWTDAHLRLVRDASGGLRMIVASIRDVTADVEWHRQALEAEQRFRLAFEHSAVGMSLFVPDGHFLTVNDALCDMLKRDAATLMSRTWQELTDPQDVDIDVGLANEILAGERDSYRLRKRYLRPDGSVMWGDLSVAAVRDAVGTVTYFISQIIDVTEKVTSAERYRILAEHGTDVVSTSSVDWAMTWVSPSVEPLLGWRPGDVLGTSFLDYIHPDDRAEVAAVHERVLTGEPGKFEVRMRTREQSDRWVSLVVTATFDDHGTATGCIARWRDIQAEHEARTSMEISERRFRMMAENASDIVFHTVEGITEWVSPSLCAVTGWQTQDLVGGTTAHLWHADDRPVAIALRDATYAGRPGRGELRFRRKDGSYVWLEVSLQPYPEPDGRTGAVGIMRDINDRVLVQQALAESEERYRLLADNSSDVVIRSRERVITWISPSVSAAFGGAPGDWVGRSVAEILHPDDISLAEAASASIDLGDTRVDRARFRALDGTFHWIEAHSRPFVTADGSMDGHITACRVVDDQVAAQSALEYAEARYRLLAENASDVVCSMDCDRRVTWVSPAVTRTLGWAHDDLIGIDLVDLVHPDDRRRTEETSARILAGHDETNNQFEDVVRVRTDTGDHRWMSVKLTRMTGGPGNTIGLVGGLTLVDDLVDQRLRAEADEERLQALLDTMLEPFVLLSAQRDSGGNVVDFAFADANPAALGVYGMPREQLIGSRLSEVHPALMRTDLFDMYVAVVDQGQALVLNDWAYPRDVRQGRVLRFDVRAVKVGDAVSQTWRDVSERYAATELLARSEEHFRLLAENSTDVVLRDLGGIVQWLSPAVKPSLGWDAAEWVGRSLRDFVHPDDTRRVDEIQPTSRRRDSTVTTLRLRGKAGDYHWVEIHAGPYKDASGRRAGFVASFRVVDHEVASREALASAEEQFRLLAENSTDVVGHARDGRIVWVSPSVTAALGWKPDDLVGMDVADVLHPDDLPRHYASRSATGQELVGVVRARLRARDGTYHWIEANTGPFLNAQGEEDGVIATFRVVDELVAAEEELAYYARFDALTGLMNRREIVRKLQGITSGIRHPGRATALLFCDIDRFKNVNDVHGHAAGDEVLRMLAERISASVRSDDAAARIGGDEFLVVLTGTHGLEEAVAVAEKIREAASEAVIVDHAQVSATLSIGVTLVHPGESIGDIIAHADSAMYTAKRAGRNQVVAIA